MRRFLIRLRLGRGHRLQLAGACLLWGVLLFGVAIPSWRRAMVRQGEIREMETRLAELDRWAVAGMWIQRAVERTAPEIDAAWDGLFPHGRRREELFLDLARIADRSDVSGFTLEEVRLPKDTRPPLWQRGSEPAGGGAAEVALEFYRIQAEFQGDFRRTARFLGGLQDLDRALTVHSLEVRPREGGIQVQLKLDVHVRPTHAS